MSSKADELLPPKPGGRSSSTSPSAGQAGDKQPPARVSSPFNDKPFQRGRNDVSDLNESAKKVENE